MRGGRYLNEKKGSNKKSWRMYVLHWRYNGHDGVSNHQPYDCLSFIQAQIKENSKAPRHWSLWGEFNGDRWIPHTKGQ